MSTANSFSFFLYLTALEEGTEDDGSSEPHIGQHGLRAEL